MTGKPIPIKYDQARSIIEDALALGLGLDVRRGERTKGAGGNYIMRVENITEPCEIPAEVVEDMGLISMGFDTLNPRWPMRQNDKLSDMVDICLEACLDSKEFRGSDKGQRVLDLLNSHCDVFHRMDGSHEIVFKGK